MHAEEQTEEKRTPKVRGYWIVDGLPGYQFNDYEVTPVVSQLVHAGATRVIIERLVVDENAQESAPVQEQPEVLVRGVLVEQEA